MARSTSSLLAADPRWPAFADALRVLAADNMAAARRDADAYGSVYEGDRAAMVFDLVASRQRRYQARVVPMVRRFRETPQSASLAALAADGPVGDFG